VQAGGEFMRLNDKREGGMRSWSVILLICGSFLLLAASEKQTWAEAANTEGGPSFAGGFLSQSPQHPASTPRPDAEQSALPVTFARETGDLDAMVKRGTIRALVLYSRTGFFYVEGRPEGIYYQALQYFQQFVNEKLRPPQPIQVVFIPVRPDQLEGALTQGVGDLIAYGLVETTARSQQVAFSIPIQTGLKQIVVTGKDFGPVSSLDDLAGKKIFVNPLTTYYQSLLDEDLLEMVNAGILPATVTLSERARLWASVLPHISPQPNLVVADAGDLAWAMRKDNPKLKQLVDEFVKTRAVGTSFGNTLLRRYLQNSQWIKNPTTATEIKKFEATVDFFKQYSSQYGFDYLMVVAQGYQESLLEQSARGPTGAIGIMQVKPSTAAAPPVNVPDIWNTRNNIEAGVKILNNIATTYFNDPKIDPENRLLFTFAAYNAGPNRIAELRRKAQERGLDPNKWFENVELLVAQEVGPITVQYVSNIYKYYVAYKLVIKQGQSLQ
jgi:membrane-bound lytic murein transglycosylase MltF